MKRYLVGLSFNAFRNECISLLTVTKTNKNYKKETKINKKTFLTEVKLLCKKKNLHKTKKKNLHKTKCATTPAKIYIHKKESETKNK